MRKDIEDYLGMLKKSIEINQILLEQATKRDDILGIKHHAVLSGGYQLVVNRLTQILEKHSVTTEVL